MVRIEDLLRPGGECRLRGDIQEVFLPDAAVARRMADIVEEYDYRDILQICTPLRKHLASKRLYVSVGMVPHSLPDALGKVISKRSTLSADDGKALLTVMLGNLRNIMAFFKSLPDVERRLMEESVKTIFVTEQAVKRITGRSAIAGRRGAAPETVAELSLFRCTTLPVPDDGRSHPRRYVFELNPIMRHSLLPVFLNERLQDANPDALPEGLRTFSGEGEVFPLMKVLEKAWRTGVLTLNLKDNKVSAPKLRAFAAKNPLREFFSSSPVGSDLTMRMQLTLHAFVQKLEFEKQVGEKPIDGLQRLKSLFECGLIDEDAMLSVMLGHLATDYRKYIGFELGNQMACIDRALAGCRTGTWMSLDRVMCLSRYFSPCDDLCIVFYRLVWDRLLLRNQRTGETVDPTNLYAQVAVTFAEAYLFMLAAFGFVEVAYTDPKEGDASCFSGLRYVRLTGLGAYVMGVAKEYQPPVLDAGRFFEVDPDNLIVRSLVTGSVCEPLLEGMAERISSSRFRVTAASFLQSCRSAGDVKDAVGTFRQVVCPKPPEVWERFFAQMTDNASVIGRHKDGQYVMWQVSPDDAELLRIVSTDSFIRKYTVKAEGFTLLVEKGRAAAVKERLKVYGYLMD